jgi:hypothetical protein
MTDFRQAAFEDNASRNKLTGAEMDRRGFGIAVHDKGRFQDADTTVPSHADVTEARGERSAHPLGYPLAELCGSLALMNNLLRHGDSPS